MWISTGQFILRCKAFFSITKEINTEEQRGKGQ